MSDANASGQPRSSFAYALVGALLCAPIALIAYWDGVQEGHHSWELLGLLRTIALGIVAGGIAGAVAFQLRWLEQRGRALSYVRWVVAVTCATVGVLLPDMVSKSSLEPLLPALFLGMCGGLGVGAIAKYLGEA
jgi:MFS family permease